jgi:hypothetical protein
MSSEGKDNNHDQEDSDIPEATLSNADQKMDTVYGDHVHQNPGMHLTGGIADDAIWQERWQQLVLFSLHAYAVPFGTIGKRFVEKVAEELGGI